MSETSVKPADAAGHALYRPTSLVLDDIEPGRRLEAWRSRLQLVDVLDRRASGPDIHGSMSRVDGARGFFGVSDLPAHKTAVRKRAGRDAVGEHVIISTMTSGSLTMETPQGSAHRTVHGGVAAYDTTNPMTYRWSQGKQLYLMLPRHNALAALGNDIAALSLALDDHPLTPYLKNQMVQLDEHGAGLPLQILAPSLDAVHGLALLILESLGSSSVEGTLTETASGRAALYAAVCRYIDANSHRRTLTTSTIAREFRCSRTTLYRVFAACDSSVADVLREARLQRARSMLESNSREPMATIAYLCGFADSSSLARQFKQRFGLQPGAWAAQFSLAPQSVRTNRAAL